MNRKVLKDGIETTSKNTFKANYSWLLRAGSVYLLVCGIAFLVFYLWSGGFSEDPSLIFLPIMLIGMPITLGFLTIKTIEFNDILMKVRPNWGIEKRVYYNDIKYIGITYLLHANKKLRFVYIKNTNQLREILNDKAKKGIILLDDQAQRAKRNEELGAREATIFGVTMSSPLLIIFFVLANIHPIRNIFVISSFLCWALLFELLYWTRKKHNKDKTYLKD